MQENLLKEVTLEIGIGIIFAIIFTIVIIYITSYLFTSFSRRITGKRKYSILALIPIARILLIAGLVIHIFVQLINPTTTNLIAFLGASGVVIGFALKDYVSSIFAGIVSLYELQYKPGDWIEINGIYGEVLSSGLRSIQILTPDDTLVNIPQQILWTTPLFNSNSGSRELLCVTNYYLHPNHDGEKVRHFLYDVALTSPFLKLNKPISIVVSEQPYYTHYKLKCYPIEAKDQFRFTSDLSIRGKKILIQNNFKIAEIQKLQNNLENH